MTVFVVDDEALIADTLVTILHDAGRITARAFYSGHEVLKAATEEAPDFLISDVAMPKMSGYELAAEIRRRYPACRILLVSGNATQQESPASGFELLSKPLPLDTLLQRVLAAEKEARKDRGARRFETSC